MGGSHRVFEVDGLTDIMTKSTHFNNDGFTLIEVLVALAVVAIAVSALLRLQLISIKMTDNTVASTHALFLAQQKIDETIAQSSFGAGTTTGSITLNNRELNWRRTVTDLCLPELDRKDFALLRRVEIDVNWTRGSEDKRLNLTTYVTDIK